MGRRGWVTVGLCLAVAAGPGAYAAAGAAVPPGVTPTVGVTSPLATQQQLEADRPIPVPDTPSCTEQIMSHSFAFSYGSPYQGSYTPPVGCAGPWAAVVLTLTGTVSGVQFDRMVQVSVGHSLLLDGSTSEPCCTGNAVTWTVQRDVTQYSALLAQPQPVLVELDNVYNSTYNGIYAVTVDLTFYSATREHPAPAEPNVVVPVTGSPMYTLGAPGQTAGTAVTFPRGLTRLTAELYGDGHGPCEEFWWGDPGNCAGTPYRELAVYLDGRLAGAAPVYPTTFTGADGPQFWEPIPSPRAWNLRPYVVDLTPFVGLLTDGRAHQVSLGVLGASYAGGDYWEVGATLLGWAGPGQTHGGLLSADDPAQPTNAISTDPSGQLTYADVATHTLRFSGVVDGPGGRVVTTVTDVMGLRDSQTPVTSDGHWFWNQTVATQAGAGPVRSTATELTYSMFNAALSRFAFTDDGTLSSRVDGQLTASSSYAESMSTSAVIETVNGVEREVYAYRGPDGSCYRHVLASEAGEVTTNRVSASCRGLGLGLG